MFGKNLMNIGNNLFNVIYCFKKIIEAMNNIWEKFNDIEKKIFYFYIIIIIFQLTPKELINILGISENNFLEKDSISPEFSQYYKITEIELFIILTLYEIRNDRILSIGRYFPKLLEDIFLNFILK